MKTLSCCILLCSAIAAGQTWDPPRAQAVVDTTQTIRLAPDLSGLTAGERTAVEKLLEVGEIFQAIYEHQRHHQALAAERQIRRMNRPDLEKLYELFEGPIATTLENKREAFVQVDAEVPGKNVYPWGMKKEEVERYLTSHSAERDVLLDTRSVVRRATAENVAADLVRFDRHSALVTLHSALHKELVGWKLVFEGKFDDLAAREKARQQQQRGALYAVPYAVAYADDMMRAYGLLTEAADAVDKDDAEFARYLRNRARDLLSNDYESGDASWVTGNFKHLNAQIGPYETYDDALFGVKAFFSFSLLLNNEQRTTELRKALGGLQKLHDSLPYRYERKVKDNVPAGVYDVIADFGQARGTNTATILPNEALFAQRYGRTILMRRNILENPELFADAQARFAAAVAPEFEPHLRAEGNFYRTLWHEVGHYLGVDRTKDGRELGQALENNADLLEEMKADLVSLFVAPALRQTGYYNDEQLRAVYASGILRVLQNNPPRRDQPYNTMQLMQWNYFLAHGVLRFDPAGGELSIDYTRYPKVVSDLLREVLAVQHAGDRAAADAFITRWTTWRDDVHGRIAQNIRNAQRYRYRLVEYGALE